MKILKLLLITLMLVSVSVLSVGCFFNSDEESESEQQVTTVQRGDLSVEISASGNLSLSLTEDLAFDIPGAQEIAIAEVMVEEGDSVEEGQVVAMLDTSEWNDMLTDLELALIQAEISLKNAELTLAQAEDESVTLVTGDIVYSSNYDDDEIDILELKVDLAEAQLEDAQQSLDEAQEKSPEVVAPFDGFVTNVNKEGGDEVFSGTVVVTIADTDKFEAEIAVSELDIVDVVLGGTASVEVDALDITVPAEVTFISPTSTNQSGVITYAVTVELASLDTLIEEQQAAMPDISSGELPEQIQQAIDEGQMTQEEAEVMQEQMQEQMQQMLEEQQAAIESIELREGLTVTVSIVTSEATDALLVPNGAILTRGQESYVQIVSSDGTVEDRTVTTGISDWEYTEVTDGLSEGEQVLIPEGTTVTTDTSSDQGFGGPPEGMFMPGMGGPG